MAGAYTFIFSEEERAVTDWVNPTSYKIELGSRLELVNTVTRFGPNLRHFFEQISLEYEINDPNKLDDADLAVLIRKTVIGAMILKNLALKNQKVSLGLATRQLTPTIARSQKF